MTDEPKRKITPLWQRTDWIESLVRRIAADPNNVDFTLHAFEREDLREISTVDALKILRTGQVSPGIREGKEEGEWVCKIVKRLHPNQPEIGVVTVIINQQRLLVLTLEWEYPQ